MSIRLKKTLNPLATAVWLVQNTALTFKQIAGFCDISEYQVKGIADNEVAQNIIGEDPVLSGQLTSEEISRCTKDPNSKLRLKPSIADELSKSVKQRAKYIPIARRKSKPDAICWLLKYCPGIKDRQIIKLIGTTKSTVQAIRDRTHWNSKNLRFHDPVYLGLCSQTELDHMMREVELSQTSSEEQNSSAKED